MEEGAPEMILRGSECWRGRLPELSPEEMGERGEEQTAQPGARTTVHHARMRAGANIKKLTSLLSSCRSQCTFAPGR